MYKQYTIEAGCQSSIVVDIQFRSTASTIPSIKLNQRLAAAAPQTSEDFIYLSFCGRCLPFVRSRDFATDTAGRHDHVELELLQLRVHSLGFDLSSIFIAFAITVAIMA
jgi:hypothetical protein